MTTTASKLLVIDASVARAAGDREAIHPTARHCRDFLDAVRTICHRVVRTSEISSEWREHQSNYARIWFLSMCARRKVVNLEPSHDELYAKIEGVATSEKDREAMEKDLCLVEAALDADQIVVSLDETVRVLFAQASQRVGELKNVMWVNPAKTEEQPITWLEDGAQADVRRQLGDWNEQE